MTEIYAPLDPGIAEVVNLLRSKGFDTFSSCEGGEGHDFDMPTVRINPRDDRYMDEDEIKISALLSENDYGGYYIKLCHAYQSDVIPWRDNQNFIEIEFWTYPLCKNSDKTLGSDENGPISPVGNLP